jgi:putative Holliday junction resolvase
VRALGVDLGSRRIGVAISDPTGTIASPVEVVQRSGSVVHDHRRLLALAHEWEADTIVVGLPLSLDGSVGPAARAVLDEVEALRAVSPMPVDTVDERLSTVVAQRHLREMGVDNRKARKVVDKLAAAVLLQAWLEQGGNDNGSPASDRRRPDDGWSDD